MYDEPLVSVSDKGGNCCRGREVLVVAGGFSSHGSCCKWVSCSCLPILSFLMNGSFLGDWYFLSDGVSGTHGIKFCGEELEHYLFAGEFTDLCLKQDGLVLGEVFKSQPVLPKVWKQNIEGKEAGDGKYRYWHWATWPACIGSWDSVRDRSRIAWKR